MTIQRLYKLFTIGLLSCMTVSCQKDFLDTKIDTLDTEETLNTNFRTLSGFANAPYTALRNEFTIMDNNLFAPVSDEAAHTSPVASATLFNNGSWNAFNNPDNYYANYYSGIRAANYFIENSADYRARLALNRDTIDAIEKINYQNDLLNMGWYRAEARMLRAFYYFELIKRYGGVPLVTKVLSSSDNLNIPKSSYQDIVQFIVNEVDIYKDSLQADWKTSSFANNDGRFNKGAALALKAKALLFAASPLNNPGNSVDKWKLAAAAYRDLIVFGTGKYSLDPNYRNYFLLNNTLTSIETIWAIRYPASNTLERNNYPIATSGGQSGVTPSQNLVDAYEYKGAPVPGDPYANRDPRLGFSIVTNNSTWNARTIDESPGGSDDMNMANSSRTGYYLKKFLNDGLNLTQGQTVVHNWPVFRYGEILLAYAEAMNEAYGPDVDNGYGLSAKAALNTVRGRVGVEMPPVTVTDQTAFRAAVKRERRVELAFENYRYWDLLRWKDAEVALNQPIRGVRVSKTGPIFNYTPITVENRVFDASKMYVYPFPQKEIIVSDGVLVQNPNW